MPAEKQENVFEGTKREVFAKTKNAEAENTKYNRLAGILENVKESDWKQVPLRNELPPTTSTSKYNKFSEKKQDLSEEN
jgi:hypothetical protein